jgi:hypothetical protein
MSLGRRDFLAVTGSAAVGLIGGSWSGDGAQARAPVSKSRVPGFYRFSLGQFQLTVVVWNRAVGFQHPDWRGGFDLDRDQSVKTRRAFLDRCASEKAMVSSYHLPFPGIGHVVRSGTTFSWLPSDWRWEGVSPT